MTKICCICGQEFKCKGYEADPLVDDPKQRCCVDCKYEYVETARSFMSIGRTLTMDDVRRIEKNKELRGEIGTCCICGRRYQLYGNNPDPLVKDEGKRCCHRCDILYVTQARAMAAEGKTFTLEDAKKLEAMNSNN